jgi:hypothetical protein
MDDLYPRPNQFQPVGGLTAGAAVPEVAHITGTVAQLPESNQANEMMETK